MNYELLILIIVGICPFILWWWMVHDRQDSEPCACGEAMLVDGNPHVTRGIAHGRIVCELA